MQCVQKHQNGFRSCGMDDGCYYARGFNMGFGRRFFVFLGYVVLYGFEDLRV